MKLSGGSGALLGALLPRKTLPLGPATSAAAGDCETLPLGGSGVLLGALPPPPPHPTQAPQAPRPAPPAAAPPATAAAEPSPSHPPQPRGGGGQGLWPATARSCRWAGVRQLPRCAAPSRTLPPATARCCCWAAPCPPPCLPRPLLPLTLPFEKSKRYGGKRRARRRSLAAGGGRGRVAEEWPTGRACRAWPRRSGAKVGVRGGRRPLPALRPDPPRVRGRDPPPRSLGPSLLLPRRRWHHPWPKADGDGAAFRAGDEQGRSPREVGGPRRRLSDSALWCRRAVAHGDTFRAGDLHVMMDVGLAGRSIRNKRSIQL